MHEMSLLNALMNKIADLAAAEGAERVVSLRLRLGALSHFTEAHFTEHFLIASRGTIAEGARLHLTLMTDETDPDAQGVVLESVELET
jgi:hydrogenase nickel incorporation protein HypA/HybF